VPMIDMRLFCHRIILSGVVMAMTAMIALVGFELLMANEERIQLNFAQPRDVLKHMKSTGVQATAQGFRWSKSSLAQFEHHYAQFQIPETEGYPLTYHPIYLIARKAL